MRVDRLFSQVPLASRGAGVFDTGGAGFAEGAAEATRQIRGASRRAFASQQAAQNRRTKALVDRGNAAGVLGKAFVDAGGDLVDIGVQLNERRDKARRESAFATAQVNLLDADNRARLKAFKNGKPDGSDFLEIYDKAYREDQSKIVEGAGGDQELSRGISIAGIEIGGRGQRAMRTEAAKRDGAMLVAELDARIVKTVNQASTARGLEQQISLEQRFADIEAQYQNNTIDLTTRNVLMKSLRDTVLKNTITTDSNRDAAAARSRLEAGGYDHLFVNDFQRAAAAQRIDQALKQQRALEAKKIEGEFPDHIASVQETGRGRPGLRKRVLALDDAEALAEFDSQTAWARKYHETMTVIRFAPAEQVQEVMAQITPQAGQAGFRRQAALHDEAVKVLAGRFGALSGDIRDHAASLQATGEGIAGLREKVAAFSPDHLGSFDAMERQSRQLFEASQAVQSGSQEDVRQALSDLQPQSGPGFEAQQRAHTAVRKAVIDRQKALADDPFAFAAQSPGVSTREEIIALQKTMGVDTYSFMSKAEAAERVRTFEATPDDQKVLLMQQWVKDAGKHRTAMLLDLADADMPRAAMLLVSHANDPAMFRVLDRVFAAESQGIDEITRNIEPADVKRMRVAAGASLAAFRETWRASGGDRSIDFANDVQDVVELLAASYMNDGMGAEEAAKLAAKKLINDHFTFVDGYRVPVQFGGNRVAAFADALREELPNFGVVFGVDLGIPVEPQMEQLLDQGYWANTSDGEGLMFMTPEGVPVANAQGQFFTFRFDAAGTSEVRRAVQADPVLDFAAGSRLGIPAERP